MRDLLLGRGGDDLGRFRRLLAATIVATFALIVIGGIVRVSDSGLGCGAAGSGTEGWPLCGGRALPLLKENAVIEFSHRLAATVVVVLIAGLCLLAFRRLRDRRWLVRGSLGAAVLVLAQAALGGLTVEHGLHSAFVAAHLGLAMLLLGLLITLRRISQPEAHEAPVDASRGLRIAAGVAAALVLATIVAGGYVAGTEGEGTANEPVLGAHLACGKEFPSCLGKFMPFQYGRLVDIQLTHRLLMYLATIAVLTMAGLALRRRVAAASERERFRPFLFPVAILACQILLGALNVWLGKHPALIVAHLTMGTILWASVVYAATRLVAVPAAARERLGAQGQPETQAVTA